jgi:arylsulfatase A-like enzyme
MKRNLLYVFADQWRYHAVGAVGQDPVQTPNIDGFAAQSMCCDQAVSTYPLCSPHRAALLTGRYPLSCGMWTNCKIGLSEKLMLHDQEVLISDVLHDAGYDTAYVGKWHLDSSELNFSAHPESGARGWDAYTPPGDRRHHFDFWYSYGAMDDHLDPHYWMDDPTQLRPGLWSVEHETDVALEYLARRQESGTQRPFCMFLSWNPPHPPYDQVPQRYLDLYPGECDAFRANVPSSMRDDPAYHAAMRQYFAAVSGVDDQFGRILDFLRANGLDDDTLVVLSSDHGDCLGSHGVYGKNIWWEESIRIPLYVRGPGVKAGHTDSLVVSCDHMPTLLDLLDVPIPDTVEGLSHAAVLRGASNQFPIRTHAFHCMIPGMPETVQEYTRRGLDNRGFGWRAVRTLRHTYVVDNGTVPEAEQKRWLFDNETDPFQLHGMELTPSDPLCREWDDILRSYLSSQRDGFLLEVPR